MKTSAILMYLVSNLVVIGFTAYYFLKVLRTPRK